MARILAVENCSHGLRNALLRTLRPSDEVTLLPQAEQSMDSGSFKNAVFKLNATEAEVPAAIFSSNWFCGVTAVRLDDRDVEPLLKDPSRRRAALAKLKMEIESEMADSSVAVGPHLDGDSNDRDKLDWTAGFDSQTCCVGLFCSEHSRAPELGMVGQNRVHRESYLVCRAGGGVAATTFHTRLLASIRKGRSLAEALEGGCEPGPQGLRRVSMAASRNRARILLRAAEILGFTRMPSIADQPSQGKLRGAVPTVDVHTNTLRKIDNYYQYATGLDCSVSQGVITCSNVSDGFLLYVSSQLGAKLNVRNEAASCIPFATLRLQTNKTMAERVVNAIKNARSRGEKVHIDFDFLKDRFAWRNRDFGAGSDDVMPPCLFGSHSEESFSTTFARELGLSQATQCRLRPELVLLAGVDPSKLRGVVGALLSSG